MNERIKELEKQCWSHRVAGVLVDGQLHFDTDKFAELIVRECISIAEAEKADYVISRKHAWDFEEKNIYAEGEAASDIIRHKIKRNFGIE